jgi:hypothetical protein
VERAEEDDIFRTLKPSDFDLHEIRPSWEEPCWIEVSLILRPLTEAAKTKVILPIRYTFKADVFAKRTLRDQMSSQIWSQIDRLRPDALIWANYLYNRYDEFLAGLDDLARHFPSPCTFVPRSAFRSVKIDEALRQPIDEMEIYLADDTNSDRREITTLRIHSRLSCYRPNREHLWFEKKVHWKLYREDILPWFRALVGRLPKKKQPFDLTPWEEKFSRENPEIEKPNVPHRHDWNDKPPITLIFGKPTQLGSSVTCHLHRDLIHSFLRKDQVIEIRASYKYIHDGSIEPGWTYRLFTPSALHAEVLEHALLGGEEIQFALGPNLTGMLVTHGDAVSCIGVDTETIHRYCDRPGMALVSLDPPRFKFKYYRYQEIGRDTTCATEIILPLA